MTVPTRARSSLESISSLWDELSLAALAKGFKLQGQGRSAIGERIERGGHASLQATDFRILSL